MRLPKGTKLDEFTCAYCFYKNNDYYFMRFEYDLSKI